MYIADYSNQRIRKVTVSTGIITTIAGTGAYSYSSNDDCASYRGDGDLATSAVLSYPQAVAVDSSGRDYSYSLHLNLYYKHYL